jgi:hypothetical protein
MHKLKPDLTLDPRAEHIFRAYLQCYTFPRNVLEETTPLLRQEHANGEFPWPEDALHKHHANPRSGAIGVPQGGALSCIIANLVLDLADKRIRAVQEQFPDQIQYFRYCDDMILLARRESHCQEAFQAYLNALDELKLPYHEPKSVETYNKRFWNEKSKNPYCWTGRKGSGCVPWVQFVGYQVRYDGLVRIKKKSLEKQILKLRNVTDHVKFGLGCKPGRHQLASPPVPLHDNLGEYDRDNSGESGRGYRDNLGASRAESRVKPRLPSDLSLAELFLEVLKLKQGALATALLFCWRTGRRKRDRHLGRGFWAEPNAADVEVFLEAVQLEEVG